MTFPNLSAGTGPAALVMGGSFFTYIGNPIGIPMIVSGIALSVFWKMRI